METLVKPFLHELMEKMADPKGFKKSNTYHYIVRLSVFGIAYVESYPFREDLDIFGVLGAEGIPEFLGVVLAAFIITFFSKQVHDAVSFIKVLVESRSNPEQVEKTSGF